MQVYKESSPFLIIVTHPNYMFYCLLFVSFLRAGREILFQSLEKRCSLTQNTQLGVGWVGRGVTAITILTLKPPTPTVLFVGPQRRPEPRQINYTVNSHCGEGTTEKIPKSTAESETYASLFSSKKARGRAAPYETKSEQGPGHNSCPQTAMSSQESEVREIIPESLDDNDDQAEDLGPPSARTADTPSSSSPLPPPAPSECTPLMKTAVCGSAAQNSSPSLAVVKPTAE